LGDHQLVDTAWIGVVGTLAGGVVGFAGQSVQSRRQRGWQREDLGHQDAQRRESDLRLIRLTKYEELTSAASRTLIAFIQRTVAETEAAQGTASAEEEVAALAKQVEAMRESTEAFGVLMGSVATVEMIAGPLVRVAVERVSDWLAEALTRTADEGWADVLTGFSPLLDACKDAMRAELAGA
jgi:hypothetical protein